MGFVAKYRFIKLFKNKAAILLRKDQIENNKSFERNIYLREELQEWDH